jgi:hypothetical protein
MRYTVFLSPPRPHGKKAVQAFITVEKWKQLRNIVRQCAAKGLITQAFDMLDDKYPAQRPAGARPRRLRRGPS